MGKKKKKSFEDSLAELERIVETLEGGNIPLDRAIAEYEKGVGLLKECCEKLEKADKKIKMLVKDAGGNTILKEFDGNLDADKGAEDGDRLL